MKDKTLPFGKPFNYTETLEFTSEKKPWYKRLLKRQRRLPLAWIVPDETDQVQAHMMKQAAQEVRISPVEPRFIDPVYDGDVILGFLTAVEKEEQAI